MRRTRRFEWVGGWVGGRSYLGDERVGELPHKKDEAGRGVVVLTVLPYLLREVGGWVGERRSRRRGGRRSGWVGGWVVSSYQEDDVEDGFVEGREGGIGRLLGHLLVLEAGDPVFEGTEIFAVWMGGWVGEKEAV